jgi:hypothetical protein
VPSLLAWLDYSEEDHRRMRELVALFAQEESRDELGIGAIRDAFSDRLFPGVSVIQTRARYLLFVPWIYRAAEQRGLTGAQLRARAEAQERRLVETLRRGGDLAGLIGRVAGPGVKILPSTIYWTGLQTYGIARHPGTFDQAIRSLVAVRHLDEADELAERVPSLWHPTLPPAPPGFFDFESDTFAVQLDEASFLVERIVDRVPDSLHAHLLLHRMRLAGDAAAPWLLPTLRQLPEELRGALEHARLFSLAMHGAALLYNLLLARRGAELGYDGMDDHADHYEDQLANWWGEVAPDPGVHDWDRTDFWRTVRASNPNVTPRTVAWVDSWLDGVVDGTAAIAATDTGLASLVSDRERRLKGSKSRLVNDRLLAAWNGSAGTARLLYRWPTVRTQLLDLFDGLERHDAGA